MSSIHEVVALIEELYSPHPKHDVNQIQQSLQSIQKSEQGFHLANELLSDDKYSANVKYFGALTLTVQLNTWGENDYETLWNVFRSNLLYLTKFSTLYVSNPNMYGQSLIIIKKLMSIHRLPLSVMDSFVRYQLMLPDRSLRNQDCR